MSAFKDKFTPSGDPNMAQTKQTKKLNYIDLRILHPRRRGGFLYLSGIHQVLL